MTDPVGEVVARIAGHEPRPTIVGVTGAVGVGKTTISGILAERLTSSATSVRVIATDAFLYSNAQLEQRAVNPMHKGFPESYDIGSLVDAIETLRRGRSVSIPVYSHAIYDIVDGELETIEPTDVLIVEGVTALRPAVRTVLDIGIYVDAPEDVVRAWFVERFHSFTEAARSDPTSFYAGFVRMTETEVTQIAEMTWDAINGVNLREHIAPTRSNADVVVEKGSDHAVLGLHWSA